MRIRSSDWDRYIGALKEVNRQAADAMQAWMDGNPGATADEIIRTAYLLSDRYGEAAASLACEMYDATAEAQGAAVPPAEPAEPATYRETAKAVQGTMKNRQNTVPQTVGRLVKQTGADTMLKNARRDGAEWAWVPRGDTCAFCITLASRGWQKASKKALNGGHAEHIHANCDCEYAVRFDGKSGVEGYDPEKYLAMYENAEGGSSQEKINSMRRELEAGKRDEINARKREAYAERKEQGNGLSGSSGGGIIKITGSSFGKNGSFSSKADPMADVFGSGIVSHPKEIENFRRECEDSGVVIIHRDRESINYEPSTTIGKPGQIVINEDASYSAWCHEMQHMRDDRDNGWDGALAVWDRDEHYRREQKAYEIEVQLAKQAGRNDIAELLIENLEEERRRIYA